MSEKLKKMNSVDSPLRKLSFCKWASPKMQKIITQVCPSRQLLKTVNFAFMKIFDFLVKIALLGGFLLFLGDSCHKLRPKIELESAHFFRRRALFSAFVTRITQEKQKGFK